MLSCLARLVWYSAVSARVIIMSSLVVVLVVMFIDMVMVRFGASWDHGWRRVASWMRLLIWFGCILLFRSIMMNSLLLSWNVRLFGWVVLFRMVFICVSILLFVAWLCVSFMSLNRLTSIVSTDIDWFERVSSMVSSLKVCWLVSLVSALSLVATALAVDLVFSARCASSSWVWVMRLEVRRSMWLDREFVMASSALSVLVSVLFDWLSVPWVVACRCRVFGVRNLLLFWVSCSVLVVYVLVLV